MRFPKRGRVKLSPHQYQKLVKQILERDGWRCRRCPSRSHLQVHHVIKRSEIRLDVSWNLLTLCFNCHELVERHKVDVVWAGEPPGCDDLAAVQFATRHPA